MFKIIETGETLEFDINELVRHAIILGSTGSGKTGLLLSIVEKANDFEIPVILIDVKGDLINIANQPEGMERPVICLSPGAYHGEAVDFYSDILKSKDPEYSASCLLHAIGEDNDRKGNVNLIFLKEVLTFLKNEGVPFSIEDVIEECFAPNFDNIGSYSLDSFISKNKRKTLSSKLAALSLSDSFIPYTNGIPLDFDFLLQARDNKAPILVLAMSHISDESEWSTVITAFLAELYFWIKSKGGANKLKYLLAIDECVNIAPPSPYNPPSKKYLMLLIKQARSQGLGTIVSTQNPVNVDYRILSNCSTWMIGRLAMVRDQEKVAGAVAGRTNDTVKNIKALIGSIKFRNFVFSGENITRTVYSNDTNCHLSGPVMPNKYREMYKEKKLLVSRKYVPNKFKDKIPNIVDSVLRRVASLFWDKE